MPAPAPSPCTSAGSGRRSKRTPLIPSASRPSGASATGSSRRSPTRWLSGSHPSCRRAGRARTAALPSVRLQLAGLALVAVTLPSPPSCSRGRSCSTWALSGAGGHRPGGRCGGVVGALVVARSIHHAPGTRAGGVGSPGRAANSASAPPRVARRRSPSSPARSTRWPSISKRSSIRAAQLVAWASHDLSGPRSPRSGRCSRPSRTASSSPPHYPRRAAEPSPPARRHGRRPLRAGLHRRRAPRARGRRRRHGGPAHLVHAPLRARGRRQGGAHHPGAARPPRHGALCPRQGGARPRQTW